MMRISKESEFLLYGAGEVGSFCASALKEKGYKVIGALDKKRDHGELIQGVPIIRFATDVSVEFKKNEIIVLICLADGMLHKEVADDLYQEGYRFLVFLPLRHSINSRAKSELMDLYNKCLIASDSLESGVEVEDYSKYCFPEIDSKNAVLMETPEVYTVFLNAEILFSESMELWKGDKNKVFVQGKYKDKNIMAHYQTENLWDFFLLKEEQCKDYFLAYKKIIDEEEKEKILKKREELFCIFQKEYNKGVDFFVQAAPSVVWNPKHYFNLVGGHHRTTFFLNKGHSLLPVRMQKEDFERWYNREAFEELKEYLFDNEIDMTYAPIPHPAMIEFPSECENMGTTKLKEILRFLRWKDMGKMSVLELGRSEGYYGRNMLRCGATNVEYRSEEEKALLLTKKVNEVLYIKGMRLVHGDLWIDNAETYECIFAMDMFSNLPERENARNILGRLDQIGTKYLFWESASITDKEYIQKNSDFQKYYTVYKEYRRGAIWEVGVYVKGDV